MVPLDDFYFVLADSQMTGAYIAIGSIVSLVILVVVFLAMRRPVAGYTPPPDPPDPEEESPAHPPAHETVVEQKSTGTPGFVLPLPTDVPPMLVTTPSPRTPAPPEPAAVQPETRPQDPVVPSEQTFTLQPDSATQILSPEMLGQVPSSVTQYRSVLVFRSGGRSGEAVPLESYPRGECAIGRSDVPENQLVVRDDLKISRVQHAILARDDSGRYTIQDNNSANKVYVNDRCLESAPVPLNSGDKIRLGLTEFEFVIEPVA